GLAHFVATTGIVKNTLGRGGFTRVHVCTDTDVSVTFDWSLTCHCLNLGCLETEVGECLVGFCHAVYIFTLLNRSTFAVSGVKNFTSQTLRHGLLAALP